MPARPRHRSCESHPLVSPPTAQPCCRPLCRCLNGSARALKDQPGPCRSSATPTTSRSARCSSRPTSSFLPHAPRRRARSWPARSAIRTFSAEGRATRIHRLQRDAGRARAEPADRDRAAVARNSQHGPLVAHPVVALVHQFRRHSAARGFGVGVRPVAAALEDLTRLALVVAMLLVWVGANLLLDLRRSGATGAGRGRHGRGGLTSTAAAEEAAALRRRLTRALSC